MRNESEAWAEMDDTAHIESQNLRDVRRAFHDTQPNDEAEQLEAMPFWESTAFVGICMAAFFCFLYFVNWLAEQAHGQ